MNFNIDIEKLKDKEFLVETKILKKSFEYTLAKICKEYSEVEGIVDFKIFNKVNKFTKEKLFLYPFFVATSNGHSKSLFELFGKFYAPTIGPVSIEIIKYFFVSDNNSDYFIFNEFNIEVKTEFANWDLLINDIKDSSLIIEGNSYAFNELQIMKDNEEFNSIVKGIDSGILTLKEQSNGKFFIFSGDDLKYQSYKYDAFSSKVHEKNKEINYEAIERDKKKLPFYANH